MSDTLFPELVPPPPPPRAPADSYDVRLTRRRNAMLAAGVHPTTRVALLQGEERKTCGDCAHHFEHRRNRTYHKCDAVLLTHGPASDVRVGWPACVKFKPRCEHEDCWHCVECGADLERCDHDEACPENEWKPRVVSVPTGGYL